MVILMNTRPAARNLRRTRAIVLARLRRFVNQRVAAAIAHRERQANAFPPRRRLNDRQLRGAGV